MDNLRFDGLVFYFLDLPDRFGFISYLVYAGNINLYYKIVNNKYKRNCKKHGFPLARMHAPERLFAGRQDRIRKRLMDKDPMFYDQFIGPALENDTYTLEYYRDRQRQIADMHGKLAVNDDQVGRLWINPDAERLKRFDWPAMALELRGLVINKKDVYEAFLRVEKSLGNLIY